MPMNPRMNPKMGGGMPQPPTPATKETAPKNGLDNSAELKETQNLLKQQGEEAKRLATELQLRTEKHQKALKAAKAKIDELKQELADAKGAGDAEPAKAQAEVKRLEGELAKAKREAESAKNELSSTLSQLDELKKKLDEAQRSYDEEKQRLETEVKRLKNAASATVPAGADHTACEKRIGELDAALASAQASYAELEKKANQAVQQARQERDKLAAQVKNLQTAAKSGGADAAELARLQQRADELERSARYQSQLKDQALAEVKRLEAAFEQIRQERDGFEVDIASLSNELKQAQAKIADLEQSNPQVVVNKRREAIRAEARDEAAKLDPNLSDEDRDEAISEINDRARRELQKLEAKQTRLSGRFVLIAGLILTVIVGVLGYIVGAQSNRTADTAAPAVTPAPASSLPAPETTGSTAPAGTVQEPEAIETETPVPPGLPEYEEVCYPVSAKVMSLHHGRQLKDGKIFGQLRDDVPEGYHRIVCDGSREPDETGWTDVSDCKSCGPKPGSYPVEDYLEVFTGQSDPSCYTSPSNFSFHRWSKNSLHFDCGGKPQPYDALRECSDMRGCKLVLPDPKETACEVCGD